MEYGKSPKNLEKSWNLGKSWNSVSDLKLYESIFSCAMRTFQVSIIHAFVHCTIIVQSMIVTKFLSILWLIIHGLMWCFTINLGPPVGGELLNLYMFRILVKIKCGNHQFWNEKTSRFASNWDCVWLYYGGATTFACKSQGCRWAGLIYFCFILKQQNSYFYLKIFCRG